MNFPRSGRSVITMMSAALVFWAMPFALGSEETVLHRFRSDEPDPRLENVLYLNAGVELTRAGLSSTRTEDDQEYVLLTEYAASGSRTEIRYSLFTAAAPERLLATAEFVAAVDHTIGKSISDAVARVLRSADIKAVASAEAEIKGLLPEPATPDAAGRPPDQRVDAAPAAPPTEPEAPAESPAEPPAEPAPRTAEAVPEPSSAQPEPVPEIPPAAEAPAEAPTEPAPRTAKAVPEPSSAQPEPVPEIPPAAAPAEPVPRTAEAGPEPPDRKAPSPRFDSTASAAAFMLFGEATEFFHYGAAGTIAAGASWPWQSRTVSLGAKLSIIRMFNDDGVVGGNLYFSTAGPYLRLGTGEDRPYRVAADVSGGAATITVDSSGGMMTKAVPYADVGVGTGVPIGGGLFLGGSMRFLLIFDDEMLIMGASPSLTLSVEL